MSDIDGGGLQLLMKPCDLHPHMVPEFRIEIGERFVEEKDFRRLDHGACDRHTLLLPAGQFGRLTGKIGLQPERCRDCLDAFVDLILRHLHALEAEGDIVVDRHMGVKRIILEDHRHTPVPRLEIVDRPAADRHGAARDIFKPGNHAKQRGFAASRRPEEDDEFAIRNVKIKALDDIDGAIALVDIGADDVRHLSSPRLPLQFAA